MELGESSHPSEQKIIPRNLATQGSEHDCLPGAEATCIELGPGGNGSVGFGEPDL